MYLPTGTASAAAYASFVTIPASALPASFGGCPTALDVQNLYGIVWCAGGAWRPQACASERAQSIIWVYLWLTDQSTIGFFASNLGRVSARTILARFVL